MIAEDLIEVFGVMFDMCLDIVSNIRDDDIPSVLGGYLGEYVFDDEIQFLK
jgi:hypothetical protein